MERTQSTKVSGTESEKVKVEFGVPQGTVLSTLLFNIYINDIFSVVDEDIAFCFADDTGLVVSGDSWESTKDIAEKTLHKIKKWLDDSLLSLNIEKTKFVSFSLSNCTLPGFQFIKLHNNNCKLELECACDKFIERKSCIKYLGVYIDEQLSWKEHIKYVTNKIRKVIYKFRELRNILTFNSLKAVYYALVESITNYGIVVWGSAGVTEINKIQIAQKWLIKIMMFKKKRYPTELVYKESGFLTPKQLHSKAIIRFMLKNNYYKENINHGLYTRNAAQNNVRLQNPRHSVCQKHIYCSGPKMYNCLPDYIRTKPYFKCKKQITRWIVEENM